MNCSEICFTDSSKLHHDLLTFFRYIITCKQQASKCNC
nr:MAG TPA: hypothetical protein [Caudoviricetes sp.]